VGAKAESARRTNAGNNLEAAVIAPECAARAGERAERQGVPARGGATQQPPKAGGGTRPLKDASAVQGSGGERYLQADQGCRKRNRTYGKRVASGRLINERKRNTKRKSLKAAFRGKKEVPERYIKVQVSQTKTRQ